MDNDKSILEKFTDTIKDIANIATEAASHALSAEQPAFKADEKAVAYMPLAADGFVSDPMPVAPIVRGPRRKKRVPAKPVAKQTAGKAGKKATKKSARKSAKKKSAPKTAKKSAAKRSRKAAKKTTRKPAREAGRKTAGKAAKKRRTKR